MVIAIVWPERLPLVAYGAQIRDHQFFAEVRQRSSAAKSACPAVVVVLTTLGKTTAARDRWRNLQRRSRAP